MTEITIWERLIGQLGWPGAFLVFLLFCGWRFARWCKSDLAPHVPTIVKGLVNFCEAASTLAKLVAQHSELLDEIRADVKELVGANK